MLTENSFINPFRNASERGKARNLKDLAIKIKIVYDHLLNTIIEYIHYIPLYAIVWLKELIPSSLMPLI